MIVSNDRRPDSLVGKDTRFQWVTAVLLAGGGVFLSLFAHWEPSGESWGYWFFARVFRETGEWIIPGRSPLYVLYLNFFTWMDYPTRVTVEYIVTMLILVGSLTALFRKQMGLVLSAFAVVMWIPFFQTAEPPVQNLALACSCLAVLVRYDQETRFRLASSYALFVCATLFRSTYSLFLVIFAVWDGFQLLRHKSFKERLSSSLLLVPRKQDWPIFLMIVLMGWFWGKQSTHRWNDAWMATTKWFPSEGKTLSDAAFIQNYNWDYILSKYGSFEGKDFYFTSQELFPGARTMGEAVRSNPTFVAKQLIKNSGRAIIVGFSLTLMPPFFHERGVFSPAYKIAMVVLPILYGLIIFGAFQSCENKIMILFLLGCLGAIALAIVGMPKPRYMHTLMPLLVLSAHWFGNKFCEFFSTRNSVHPRLPFLRNRSLVVSLVIICFSRGVPAWGQIMQDVARDIQNQRLKVLEEPGISMKESFLCLDSLISGCHGVMSLEPLFLGAHMGIPLQRIYDPWEIPPFGEWGGSSYDGLSPERIDCVLVSSGMATTIGAATNIQIRYQNYVKPYIKNLKERGAKVYPIDTYGEAIILQKGK